MVYTSQNTKRTRYAIGIGVWLCIVAAGILLASAHPGLIAIVNCVVLIALLVLIDGGGSIYKLALWFRHRNDPDRRELIASSGQIYPKKLRQFLMDEPAEREGVSSNTTMRPGD